MENDGAVSRVAMSNIFRLSDMRRSKRVFFTRAELDQLLSLYTRQVMRGEWRDYAIDQRDGTVLFSIFRRSQELPLFTVAKTLPSPGCQGHYALFSSGQRIASAGSLAEVLTRLARMIRYSPVRIEVSHR